MAKFDETYRMMYDDEMERFAKDIKTHLENFSAQGLADDMDNILDGIRESHDRLVPEYTEATKDSWYQDVTVDGDDIKGTFGNDREGQLDYVPFIYIGQHPKGGPINFRKEGAVPFWLEVALDENVDTINRKLSKIKGKK